MRPQLHNEDYSNDKTSCISILLMKLSEIAKLKLHLYVTVTLIWVLYVGVSFVVPLNQNMTVQAFELVEYTV